jgi:DNA-directed RNA polymerase subunit RPC12/RpoP
LVERLWGLVGYYPYRCRECGHRFLQFRYARPTTEKRSETEREIRATRARIRWQRKKRAILLYGCGALIFLGFLYFLTRPGI